MFLRYIFNLYHFICSLAIIWLAGCTGIRESLPEKILIGREGNVNTITYPADADPVVEFAAQQLQEYLHRITGVKLPVSKEQHANSPGTISLTISTDTSLHWDGYRLRTNENSFSISSAQPRGLLFAVYDILEQAGCSFVYPGASEQIVPEKNQVVFSIPDTIINPLMEHRGLAPYGLDAKGLTAGRDFIDWMAKNRFNYILVSEDRPSDSDGPAHGSVWKEVNKELLPELQKRGFTIEMSEHCTPVFFPRSLFKQHPDWFALNKGERKLGPPPYSGQICYSNKAAIEYYGNSLAKYAEAHREFKTIGTWPLDGGDYCECHDCKNPQTVFNAVLTIAEKIRKVRPDMLVEHLAYKVQTWQPPAMDKIPSNISVLWCRDPGESEELVKQWKEKIDPAAGIYQFEYYLGDNYRSRANVWLRPEYAVNMVEHARTTGYRGVISLVLPIQNWWRSAFNNRFYARAVWNAKFSFNDELDKYFKAYYGVHSAEAKSIFSMILNNLQHEPYDRETEGLAANWTRVEKSAPQILQEIELAMTKSSNKITKERFNRIKTYVEYFVLYTKAYSTRSKADLRNVETYIRNHPGHEMVLMYPGYIRWRNEEYF